MKRDRHLPPGVYFKHGSHWLVKQNKWHNLGPDLSHALAEYGRRISTPKGGMDDLIDRALPLVLHNKKQSTQDQYRLAAAFLKKALIEFHPRQVKRSTMVKLRDTLIGKPNMANRILTVASLVFAKAVEWEDAESNPCEGVKRLQEKKRDRLISDDEWLAIHAKADPRLKLIMELQHLTGQRISDVLSIRRNQLKPEGIEFTQQKTGTKVTVNWTPEIREAVERAKAMNPNALTLLPGSRGKPPNYRSVSLQWQKACEAAGVTDARLNDGRAKSATATKKLGKNATALLGHGSEAMTKRYLRGREATEAEGPELPKAKER